MRLSLTTNSWNNYLKTINKKTYKALQGPGHNIWYRGKKGEKVEERRIWIQWKIDEIQKKGRICDTAKKDKALKKALNKITGQLQQTWS